MPSLIELDRGETFAFGAWGRVFVAIWHKAATPETAARVAASMKRFATQHPDGIEVVIVLEPHSGAPDTATREAISRDMKSLAPVTRRVLAVFEGEGFKAAAMRGILVGMQLLARTTTPTKVFATVLDAARWLAQENHGELDATELAAAIATLRTSVT